ncbi:MAG: hypothetical protein ACRD6B_06515 [Bryobacteraceae bacterium]
MSDRRTLATIPTTWAILAGALTARRPVAATYHGHRRLLCPHALGWKAGRPKLLAYQVSGTTSTGALPADTTQRWRSMFVDDIEHPVIVDQPWQSAANYTPARRNGLDTIALDLTTISD